MEKQINISITREGPAIAGGTVTYNVNNYAGQRSDRNRSDHEAPYAEYEEVKDGSEHSEQGPAVQQNHPVANNRPEELFTEKAMQYWRKLQQAGLMDEDFQPVGLTKAQKMYIADLFSDKLRLRYKWCYFERLWHVKHLANEKTAMQNTGNLPSKSDIIDKAFI